MKLIWRMADSTMASGVGCPYFSNRSFSSDPEFTPTRMATLWLFAFFNHLGQAVHAADVAGIDADLIGAFVDGLQSDLIGEMDVGHQRAPSS